MMSDGGVESDVVDFGGSDDEQVGSQSDGSVDGERHPRRRKTTPTPAPGAVRPKPAGDEEAEAGTRLSGSSVMWVL